MLRKLIIALAFFALAGGISAVWAEDSKPAPQEKFVLDGKTYTKTELIDDFIHVAFPSRPWINGDKRECPPEGAPIKADPSPPGFVETGAIAEPKSTAEMTENPPPAGWPKFCAIRKWDDEITIGYFLSKDHPKELTEIYTLAESQINDLLPYIAKATGHKVIRQEEKINARKGQKPRFLGYEPAEFTRIFIVPLGEKTEKLRIMVNFDPDPNTRICSFLGCPRDDYKSYGAIHFTPDLASQVEGYLVPRSGENLSMSECFVPFYLGEYKARAFISECVVRSLGLPEATAIAPQAVISDWNMPTKDDSPSENIRSSPRGLSEYDLMMVHLLYCPAIKSGMGKDEVRKTLNQNESCFEYSH